MTTICYESVPEGPRWKLMRNRRFICYVENQGAADRMAVGYYRMAGKAGQSARTILYEAIGQKIRARLTAQNKIGT